MPDLSTHRSLSPILPPRGARSLSQRLQAADKSWEEFINVARESAIRPSPASGGLQLAHLSLFLNDLIKDKALQKRVLEDFERQALDEVPPRTGELFTTTEGARPWKRR